MTAPATPAPAAAPATPAAPAAPATPTADPSTSTLLGTQPPAGDPPAVPAAPAAPAASVVPETYNLKLPDGSTLPAEALERTAATARTLGLSQEHAQQALEFVNSEVAAQRETFLAAHQPGGAEWTKQVQSWEAEILADTTIGGTPEKLQQNVALGKRVLDTFFPPDTKAFLETTGFGSHPAVIRGLVAIGKAMSEDSLIMPKAAATGKKSFEEIMYPPTSKE